MERSAGEELNMDIPMTIFRKDPAGIPVPCFLRLFGGFLAISKKSFGHENHIPRRLFRIDISNPYRFIIRDAMPDKGIKVLILKFSKNLKNL